MLERTKQILKALAGAYNAPVAEYRPLLFETLKNAAGGSLAGKKFLEIGPRDGLDSARLATLEPSELVMIELPSKENKVAGWVQELPCPHRMIYANLLYMTPDEITALGHFDLVWCTGVLYHNAEQLRLLRKLYNLLTPSGILILESAALRPLPGHEKRALVELFWPKPYGNTDTVTHLPSPAAIKAWLLMAGFTTVQDIRCYDDTPMTEAHTRYACLAAKTGEDDGAAYYYASEINPIYRLGQSL